MNNFIKNFLRKIKLSPVVIIFGIFAVVLSFFVFKHWQKPTLSPEKLLSCLTTTPQGRYLADAPCLQHVTSDLMAVYSTTDLLKYISAPSTPVVVHIYAHSIAHFIGEQTFLKTMSVEITLEQCNPDVEYGCIHGAIGAAAVQDLGVNEAEGEELVHADSTTVENVAEKFCASDNFQLCHAIGHILFQVSPDYTKILETCNKVSNKDVDKREACARGVFMEAAGPTSSLSPSLNSLASNITYSGICDQIPSAYQHPCFRHLPKIQRYLFEKNGVSSTRERLSISRGICEKLTGAPRADCIESIGLNTDGVFADIDDPSRQKFCVSFDTWADKKACILGVVGSFLNTFAYNDAVNYCHTGVNPMLKDFCYHSLFSIAAQVSMSPTIGVICDKESTANECSQKFKEYLVIKSTLQDYALGLYGDRR
ncbi:MAG: hypothetical protein Q7S75_02720 [bacterium]|nr:hypothetical protein [bacterium]